MDDNNFEVWFNTSDHTTGDETGCMMVVNGGNPGQSIFTTQVNVKENTNYVFSTWIMNIDGLPGYIDPELRVVVSGEFTLYDQIGRAHV